MTNQEIATTILSQLGGRKFLAMTGSKNLVSDTNALQMHLTRNKVSAKYLRIELKSNDTYTMTFRKAVNKNNEAPIVREFEGVYCDQLQEIFTQVTGLYTSL
jgi:hypothetical protein